ncbi:outer membrane beta-barrel family protein [Filimonas effusa]|nr:outer membrane beta-barrel family protein [Filimonas effusa]
MKVMDIDLWAEYNFSYTTVNAGMAEIFYTEVGFSRSLFKNKARLRLSFADPFNAQQLSLSPGALTPVHCFQKGKLIPITPAKKTG